MPDKEIPIPIDLAKMLKLPPCEELKLPSPSPLSITLPTGGSIKALSDMSKAIPNDCALTFSLMLQIMPLLANMECILKILKLLKPLIDIVSSLPGIPPVKAVQEFAKAAADLAPCLLVPTPANMIPFVRDILCLILKLLKCFLGQMKTLLGLMSGLTLSLNAAKDAGNLEQIKALECAQENADATAKHLTNAIEPIGALLDLLGPAMGIAGVKPIQIPAMGSETDLASLQETIKAVQGVVGAIQIAVDLLGGCPE